MSDSMVAGSPLKTPLQVWLKSEYLNNDNFRRFGARPAAFDEPCWPLGLWTGAGNIEIAPQVAFEVVDSVFEHDVSCAWQLPIRYGRLRLGTGDILRKGALNWIMRCVGRWQRGEDRYSELVCRFNDDDKGAWKRPGLKTGYALTPFSIVTQRWVEDADDNGRLELLFCDIAFFYTFETFIQECLAFEAFRRGEDRSAIAANYEHLYCNSYPRPEFVCIDPADLGLSRLSRTSIDWRDVLEPERRRPTRDIQDTRLQLFRARRQCHLLAAVTAACIGIPSLGFARFRSDAVRIADKPFAIDDLAPHWLKHVLGEQDYPSECENLLVGLAEQRGNPLSMNRRGVPEPPPWLARNTVEQSVGSQIPSVILSRAEAEAYGRYRWALFDTSLDSQSVSDWQQKLLAM